MTADITEDVRRTAREVLAGRVAVADLRKLRDGPLDEAIKLIRQRWLELCELGWSGLLIPESLGGTAGSTQVAGAVLGELGAKLAVTPMIPTAVVAPLLLTQQGAVHLKDELLPAIAAGRTCFALAIDESPAYRPHVMESSIRRYKSGVQLCGRKINVVLGSAADYLIVSARDELTREPHLVVVDTRVGGVEMEHGLLLDSQPVSTVTFNRVDVPAAYVLGGADGESGETLVDRVLDWAAISVSAEMIGAATQALTITVDYLKTRRQFGVVVGSFQALQHRLARLFTEIELSRGIVDEALDCIHRDAGEMSQVASACKARVSAVLIRTTAEALQLHGGIGMTDEADIGFYLKRARVAAALYGDAAYHRDRFARLRGY